MLFLLILRREKTLSGFIICICSRLKLSPDVNEINENIDAINQEKSQMLFIRISKAFKQQQQQAEIFKEHKKECYISSYYLRRHE